MMKYKKEHLVSVILFAMTGFLLIHPLSIQAQKDGLNNQVVIEKEAQITVIQAEKEKFTPQIVEREVPTLKLQYEVPSRLIVSTYSPTQLKPVGTGKEDPIKSHNSYISIAMGSLLSPQVDLAYNDIQKKKFTYGLHYHFLMAQGKLENQKMNEHIGGIYADFSASKQFKIGFNTDFNHNTHHFYGYDHQAESYTAANIRQTVNCFSGKIYITNPERNKAKFDYKQDIGCYYMFNRSKINEYSINGNTNFLKQFKTKHFLHLGFNFDINQLNYPVPSDSVLKRNIFKPSLDYTFDDDDWQVKGGLGLGFDNGVCYLLPAAGVEKRLYKHLLIFYAKWDRQYQKNSYYSTVSENPFIHDHIELKNTRVENRSVGLKGSIKNFDYDIKFTNQVVWNLPLYINDSTDMKRFYVLYDKSAQLFQVQLEAGYTLHQHLRFDLLTNYTSYNLSSQPYAWHLPAFKLNFRTTYRWKDKLGIWGDINSLAGANARRQNGDAQSIKGMVDINLGASYQFHKYFSVFCSLNNIAHMKYEYWYQYPGFGFNATAGLKFSY